MSANETAIPSDLLGADPRSPNGIGQHPRASCRASYPNYRHRQVHKGFQFVPDNLMA